jgi:hypothetical protein
MKLTANLYLIVITGVIVTLGFLAVLGVGILSGIGFWPNIGNPFGMFQGSETVIHDERPAIIHEVQSLGRLETNKYVLEKIIEAEKSGNFLKRDFLFGDQIFLVAHGYVTAGVDLSILEEADINVTGDDSVWVMLPPSEIFVATLDNERTQVYDRNRGWLTRGDVQLESEARREAEHLILQAACDDGILEKAAEDAESQLTRFLGLLEFEEVTVIAQVGECDVNETDDS